jgi:hypothetical protein
MRVDPLDKRDSLTRESANVLEAYKAVYTTVDRRWVRTIALRYDDPKWTTNAAMARLSGGAPRIIRGSVAVLVERMPHTTVLRGIALEEACYNVVRDYVSSVRIR